jgi:hypothetical protein
VLVVDEEGDINSTTLQDGEVSENSITESTNLYYHLDLGGGYWAEPLIGQRYTYTAYGSGAEGLGLTNGQVFRIQGGIRLGSAQAWGGSLVNTSVVGMLYSDVWVDGFALTEDTLVSTASEVDEGKLRGLGQVMVMVGTGDGMTYSGQVEVRGGEDLIGVGGRLGARYEW